MRRTVVAVADEKERANGSPRRRRPLPVADSDRRLTFGSYAASSERQSVTMESMDGGVETENGIGCCEGWRVRQFLWLTQIGPGWGEKER